MSWMGSGTRSGGLGKVALAGALFLALGPSRAAQASPAGQDAEDLEWVASPPPGERTVPPRSAAVSGATPDGGAAGSGLPLVPEPNRRPVARLALSPESLGAGTKTVVTLDATGSFDPDPGQTLGYLWQVPGAVFLGGTHPASQVAQVSLPASNAAIPVRLTVHDDAGQPLQDTRIAVLNPVSVQESAASGGRVGGEPAVWHTVEVSFRGPLSSEMNSAPNPFLDYRATVVFQAPSGAQYTVPGFFDGDGQGGGTGDVWKACFTPDEPGSWTYRAGFREGSQVAVSSDPLAGQPAYFNGAVGAFVVLERDRAAEGFLAQGRLEYVGGHYLKFRDGGYFIKGGTDSPENFLGYKGFDDVQDSGGGGIVHEYAPHIGDWEPGDPYFISNTLGVDSKGIIGALNYLSRERVNSIYFLPMNLGGDGQETCPFVGYSNTSFDKLHYDISRLRQWTQVFEHAQRRGILLHFVLNETEQPNETWLDGGLLGVERKLFYRELVARFGHSLALKWNLCEENDFPVSRLIEFAGWIASLDVYDHPIGVHTHPNNFQDYWQLLGNPLFSSTSIQYDAYLAGGFVEEWRTRSANAGRKWVLDMDENTPWNIGLSNTNADELRKTILYDVYFSGGQLEWYAGYHPLPLGGDLRLEDFRTREAMWRYMWYARRLMQERMPFWEMEPMDQLLSGESQAHGGGQVFALPGEVYAVYLPDASSASTALDLGGATGTLRAQWFDPRSGQFQGTPLTPASGQLWPLGPPPSQPAEDWVLLIEKVGN